MQTNRKIQAGYTFPVTVMDMDRPLQHGLEKNSLPLVSTNLLHLLSIFISLYFRTSWWSGGTSNHASLILIQTHTFHMLSLILIQTHTFHMLS